MSRFIRLSVVMLCLFWPYVCYPAVYTIDNSDELIARLARASEGDTILLEDGEYSLGNHGAFKVDVRGVTIRSSSGVRENVVVTGLGMHGDQQNGLYIDADDVTIAEITIQKVRNHCLQLAPGRNRLHVKNCVLRDAGEQILKGAGKGDAFSSKDCIVVGCLFEYSAGVGPRFYVGGIDVHNGFGWIVRNNTFKNIRSPGDRIAEHAIHFWSESRDTLVENNLIVNCDRGIGFGMGDRGHHGGIIQDNIIFHDGTSGVNDVGIILESSPGTTIRGNSVCLLGAYPNSIEYRFQSTRDVIISGNLVNKPITARDGAEAVETGNRIAGMLKQ